MATIRELTDAESDLLAAEGRNSKVSEEETAKAVDKCLEVLNRAKTDTERFAALLLVSSDS